MRRFGWMMVLLWVAFPAMQSLKGQDSAAFVPGFSAFVVKKGQLEYGIYSAYAAGQKVHSSLAPYHLLGKQHVFASSFQATYGLSAARSKVAVNAGLDIDMYLAGSRDATGDTLPRFSLRPRIRWTPLPGGWKGYDISLQHSFSVPLSGQSRSFHNQLIVARRFPSDIILMGQVGLAFLSRGIEDDTAPTATSLSLYAGRLYRRYWLPFAFISRNAVQGDVPWAPDDKRYRRQDGIVGGLGLQYALASNMQVYASLGLLLKSERGGGAHSLNFGLRSLLW